MKLKRCTQSFVLTLSLLLAQVSSMPARAIDEFLCTDVTEISQAECLALVALYDSTNGAGWLIHTNWLETLTPSEWYGVTVDSGFVTQLTLEDNGLSGTLPPELSSLTNLTHLDLSVNQINDTIPPELGSLSNLLILDLGFNQISGSIPPELGNLSNLSELHLNSNQLSDGIPSQLGELLNLSRLYLYDNLLSGPIPTELSNLTTISILWLSGNQLTGSIPSDFSHLTSMSVLRLAGNQLDGNIPEELGALTGLTQLSLADNQLTGDIPTTLGDVTSLEVLSLAHNQLTGSIPLQLGYLANLFELDLSSNQLSGSIPPTLGDLTRLYMLLLDDNQLSGDVPDITSLINLLPPDDLDGPGLNLDYNALTVPEDYVNLDNPLHVFLSEFDPNWHTLQAFEQSIGDAGGVLTSLDGRASFNIPAGALSDLTKFTFTPLPAPNHSPGALVDMNHSFLLTAEDIYGTPLIAFNSPITATLTYTDADLLVFPENSLALFYWDGGTSTWLDAVTTCEDGVYSRDLTANTFSLPLCHLSDFSVFGLPGRQICLPFVVRRAGGSGLP